ncbi:MAG TPA: hypothetical protein VLZ07_12340 [Syntrophales bacterium]|nr:hypothetical protein [Syntrophales bacterium]
MRRIDLLIRLPLAVLCLAALALFLTITGAPDNANAGQRDGVQQQTPQKTYPEIPSPPNYKEEMPPSQQAPENRGALNPRTGEYYPPSGNGVINPRTGEYYPPSGQGFINPRTGAFYPHSNH